MSKKKLIQYLENDVYCRLGVSLIKNAGVGVIAIKDIPKGVNPFKLNGLKTNPLLTKTIYLNDKELKDVDKATKKILTDFFHKEDEGVPVPIYGPYIIDISFYLNHSENNNIDIIFKKNSYNDFITNCDIKKGDELTINYKDYN
jgi:SET domain-containing protein